VLGLPSSAGDFKLLWLIPGLNWGSVRLEYELSSSPGHPSATVISTDLKTNPKNAQMFSSSLEKAVVDTGEETFSASARETPVYRCKRAPTSFGDWPASWCKSGSGKLVGRPGERPQAYSRPCRTHKEVKA